MSIKQKSLEILAKYIMSSQLFIDYAGSSSVDLIMDFLDSKEFKVLNPVVEDIKYIIKDFINDDSINPSQLETLINGMIDYSYRDLIDRAVHNFFDGLNLFF